MFPGLTGTTGRKILPVNNSGIGSDNRMQGPIATQNLGGNSLTQTMRSGQNYALTQGADTYGHGADITDVGVGGFGTAGDTTGTALGTTGTALGTTDKALSSLSPAEDYWTKLLSGDQATMNQAISPFAAQAAKNYGSAATGASQNMNRGGYASALTASLPQAQARDVNQQLYSLQPTAATNLNTIANTKNAIAGTQTGIAGTQGNIAMGQGQLANWLASLGIDVSKLGAGLFTGGMDSIMAGRGQDVAEHGQSMTLAGQAGADLSHGIKPR